MEVKYNELLQIRLSGGLRNDPSPDEVLQHFEVLQHERMDAEEGPSNKKPKPIVVSRKRNAEEVAAAGDEVWKGWLLVLREIGRLKIEELRVDEECRLDFFENTLRAVLQSMPVRHQTRLTDRKELKKDESYSGGITFKSNGEFKSIRYDLFSMNLLLEAKLKEKQLDMKLEQVRRVGHRIHSIWEACYDNLKGSIGASPSSKIGGFLLKSRAGNTIKGKSKATSINTSGEIQSFQAIRGLYTQIANMKSMNTSFKLRHQAIESTMKNANQKMNKRIGVLRKRYERGSPISKGLSKYNPDLDPKDEVTLADALMKAMLKVPPMETLPVLITPSILYSNDVNDYIIAGNSVTELGACKAFNIAMQEYGGKKFQDGDLSAILEGMKMLRLCRMDCRTVSRTFGITAQKGFLSKLYGIKYVGIYYDYIPKMLGKVQICQFLERRKAKADVLIENDIAVESYDFCVKVKATMDVSMANDYTMYGGSGGNIEEIIEELKSISDTFTCEEGNHVILARSDAPEGKGPLIYITKEMAQKRKLDWEERSSKRKGRGTLMHRSIIV
jgi:hypothetical protein